MRVLVEIFEADRIVVLSVRVFCEVETHKLFELELLSGCRVHSILFDERNDVCELKDCSLKEEKSCEPGFGECMDPTQEKTLTSSLEHTGFVQGCKLSAQQS